MKKIIIAVLLLVNSLLQLIAQGNYGSNIYLNEYLAGYSQILTPVMQKVNNTYYYMAYINKPTPFLGINFKNALINVDDEGITNEYLLDSLNLSNNPDFGKNIFQLDDSTLLMTAYSPYFSENYSPYFIRKFNLLSDTTVNYVYFNESNSANFFREIIKFNSDLIVLCYHQQLDVNSFSKSNIQINRYDNNFNEIQTIPFAFSHRDLPDSKYESRLIDNTNILISGSFLDVDLLAFANNYPMRHNLWVFKLNQEYQIVKEYRDNSDGTLGGSSIIKANDGGYLVFTGKRARDHNNPPPHDDMFSHTSFKGLVVKLDENLNFQWEKAYTDSADAHGCSFRDAIRTSDGNIVAVGNYFGYQTPDCDCKDMLIWLVKMNENGDVLWQRKYRSLPNYNKWTITKTMQILEEDNGNLRILNELGIIEELWKDTISGFFMNIFRTDANGCIASDCESIGIGDVEAQLNIPFQLYPNPASEFISLHFLEQQGKSYQITITDMQGRILQNKTCVNDGYDSIISLQGYSTGTYLVHVQQNGKRVGSKIFIKQ